MITKLMGYLYALITLAAFALTISFTWWLFVLLAGAVLVNSYKQQQSLNQSTK